MYSRSDLRHGTEPRSRQKDGFSAGYKYSRARKSTLVLEKKTVISAKVEYEIAEAVRERPERIRNASAVMREAVVDLLRGLGYLEA